MSQDEKVPDFEDDLNDEHNDEHDPDNGSDDPFYYSDDSESLTDNYFNPQYGDDPFYGSFDKPSPSRIAHQMQYPPILEDAAVTQASHLVSSPFRTFNRNNVDESSTSNTNDNNNRRHRKKKKGRRQQHQTQGDHQRERAVRRIRGELQSPNEYHGTPWAVLFLIQVLFVMLCAVRYGWTLVNPPSPMNKNRFLLNQQQHQHRHLRILSHHSNTTEVPKALMNVSSSVNDTVAYSKDLQNLQDDDFIQLEQHSKASGLVKDSGLVTTNTDTTQSTSSAQNSVTSDPTQFRIDYRNVISIFSISGVYAIVTSYLIFGFMLSVARSVIPIVLIFTVVFCLCWGVFGLTVLPHCSIAILGFATFLMASIYTVRSWNRIPFCSMNLYTALRALRDTRGILCVGIGSLFVTFMWLLIWCIALIGIFNTSNAKECRQSMIDCRTHLVLEHDRYLQLAILIFSLFWTCIVIKNVVRTTVAGACGAWWFGIHGQPQRCACLDTIIWNNLLRACSYSFGSICLGSLLEIPIQLLSMLGGTFCCDCSCHRAAAGPPPPSDRPPHEIPIKRPIASEKSLNSISSWEGEDFAKKNPLSSLSNKMRYCNRWCYTYIGIYSYPYLEGGEKAYQLFITRGWMTLARDNLVENVLSMASIAIGGTCGVFAVLVEEVDGFTFTSLHQPILTSFWIGAVAGFVLSNILLVGVVGSALNTVLVCFAAEPFEFDKNHPRLSDEMRDVWTALVWESRQQQYDSTQSLETKSRPTI
eukprot:scaffold6052_cov118-Cylindrotheca_fusiformis.AAC.13